MAVAHRFIKVESVGAFGNDASAFDDIVIAICIVRVLDLVAHCVVVEVLVAVVVCWLVRTHLRAVDALERSDEVDAVKVAALLRLYLVLELALVDINASLPIAVERPTLGTGTESLT